MLSESFLERIISKPFEISKLNADEVTSILNKAKKILDKEHILVEINQSDPEREILVVGDIHGNLRSLLRILDISNELKPEYIVFLGDFVDRGPFQLECLLLVSCLKLLKPKNIILLKGNHENLQVNKSYGFYQVLMNKFKGQIKFNEIEDFYTSLPTCATINDKILCLHGGIPKDIQALKKMRKKKIGSLEDDRDSQTLDQLIYQITWNDPKNHVKGFSPNYRGPGIYYFGKDAFDKFLIYNGLNGLVRSHEYFLEGFKWYFNQRLLSIFSSFNYRGEATPSPASIAVVKSNELHVKTFFGR
ncbi:MAG: metallophosphoesterase [Promethearchaeota archaeon]